MANAVYPKWKEAVAQGTSGSSLTGTLRVVLVDLAEYTYNASDEFLDDVPSAARVGAPQEIGNVTFLNGRIDGDNVTFPSVSGDPCEAVLLFLDTEAEETSRLFAYLDTNVGGLPVTPNGGNISITWAASGIVQL